MSIPNQGSVPPSDDGGPRHSLLLGADSLLGARTGVGRMTWQIAAGLRHCPGIAALRLLVGDRAYPAAWLDGDGREPASESRAAASGGRWRERLSRVGPLVALRGARTRRRLGAVARALPAPALYHEPNLIARPFDGVTVVTVNDLSWRVAGVFHPAARTAWIERRLPGSLRQATRFVAISAFTAAELTRQFGIDPARIDVVPLAPAAPFRPLPAAAVGAVLARHGLAPDGFVLSVSTVEPRKNFDRLLAAHQRLPAALRRHRPLAIAGGEGWGDALTGADAARALAAGELRLLGRVTDADLAALYGGCAAFAFPSLYEGFGLPVVEAMACGAPVLASATTATGETAGDGALLVDPHDTGAIARGLEALLDDPPHAVRLRTAGLARAAEFSWARTIAGLRASWRRALTG